MQTFIGTQSGTAFLATQTAPKSASLFRRLLNAVLDADARYRQAHKLRNLPDERLQDMGISRQEANVAFYARYGNRPADQVRMPLQNRM